MLNGDLPGVRCFVCLEPDVSVRKNLERWIDPLKEAAPRLRWVRQTAIHLTLKFCGEIPAEKAALLAGRLRRELSGSESFTLGLEGTGFFSQGPAPRVLWGGIKGDMAALGTLFTKVERAAVSCGIPRERRPFSPHLTLARIRTAGDLPGAWVRSGPPGNSVWGTWMVREVTFLESELRPEGPRYRPIEKYMLLKSQGGGR